MYQLVGAAEGGQVTTVLTSGTIAKRSATTLLCFGRAVGAHTWIASDGRFLTMQRKPMWVVEVSMASLWRAAGR